MSVQPSLFEQADVKVEAAEPEPRTTVRVGTRVAEVPLRKRRREALEKLLPILEQLEGKDVYVGFCDGASGHFWFDHLKLGRLHADLIKGGSRLPGVIVLWGKSNREAQVRVFTDQLVGLRQQEYSGYTLWLLDFWNGFQHPIDPYKKVGHQSLQITRFKD